MTTKVNEEVIESAREAWNELSLLFGDKESALFTEDDKPSFELFYKTLCEQLLEDGDQEGY